MCEKKAFHLCGLLGLEGDTLAGKLPLGFGSQLLIRQILLLFFLLIL